MPASLLNAPPEIVQRIVFYAVLDTPLGPPRELVRLSQTCQASHSKLTHNASKLYTNIFAQKFDIRIPARRLGRENFYQHTRDEMRRRFIALKCFQQSDLDDPAATEAFWIAYLMLLDTDSGQKNVKQLLWADLPAFAHAYLRQKLYDGAEENHGWPTATEASSLAIAILWLLSSQSSVKHEPKDSRDELLSLLAPYVFAAFRYPLSSVPEYLFDFGPEAGSHKPVTTIHGVYPPLSPTAPRITYFGDVTREVAIPSASLSASLLYFTRLETSIPAIPGHLNEPNYKTRAEADAEGLLGPTLEDIDHFINSCRTHFAEFSMCEMAGDVPHELGLPPYELGDLTGRWQGSVIMPFLAEYERWLNEVDAPREFQSQTTGRAPLYATLQEYYTCDRDRIAPLDEPENGSMNAWLSLACQWRDSSGGIEILDEHGISKAFYHAYRPGKLPEPGSKVVDVLIRGKTDERHAAAWGATKLIGRVRLSDGLVVISKESLSGLGNTLLRGYMTPSQNLVGRVKGASSGMAPAMWEAPFILSKDTATALSGLSVVQHMH